jgi:hypothetical protein
LYCPRRPNRLWGSTNLLSKWYRGLLSSGVKRPGREADHSPPASAEVKANVDLYIHSPIRLHGTVLYLLPSLNVQHRYVECLMTDEGNITTICDVSCHVPMLCTRISIEKIDRVRFALQVRITFGRNEPKLNSSEIYSTDCSSSNCGTRLR